MDSGELAIVVPDPADVEANPTMSGSPIGSVLSRALSSDSLASEAGTPGLGLGVGLAFTTAAVATVAASAGDSDTEDSLVMSKSAAMSVDEMGNETVNDFALWQELGRGMAGTVYLAINNTTGELRALKAIPRKRVERVTANDEQLLVEVAIMKKIRHPHVVALYECIDDPTADFVYLVMQYIPDGSLAKLSDAGTCDPVPPKDAKRYMRQLVHALYQIHVQGVVHGDIKPDNILIDKNPEGANDDGPRAYLADFGVGRVLHRPNPRGSFKIDEDSSSQGYGTPLFFAPELFEEGTAPSKGSDIWALGVTFFAILYGRLPFQSCTYAALKAETREVDVSFLPISADGAAKDQKGPSKLGARMGEGSLFDDRKEDTDDLSAEWCVLLNRMVDPNPHTRISVAELVGATLMAGSVDEGDLSLSTRVLVTDNDIRDAVTTTSGLLVASPRKPRKRRSHRPGDMSAVRAADVSAIVSVVPELAIPRPPGSVTNTDIFATCAPLTPNASLASTPSRSLPRPLSTSRDPRRGPRVSRVASKRVKATHPVDDLSGLSGPLTPAEVSQSDGASPQESPTRESANGDSRAMVDLVAVPIEAFTASDDSSDDSTTDGGKDTRRHGRRRSFASQAPRRPLGEQSVSQAEHDVFVLLEGKEADQRSDGVTVSLDVPSDVSGRPTTHRHDASVSAVSGTGAEPASSVSCASVPTLLHSGTAFVPAPPSTGSHHASSPRITRCGSQPRSPPSVLPSTARLDIPSAFEETFTDGGSSIAPSPPSGPRRPGPGDPRLSIRSHSVERTVDPPAPTAKALDHGGLGSVDSPGSAHPVSCSASDDGATLRSLAPLPPAAPAPEAVSPRLARREETAGSLFLHTSDTAPSGPTAGPPLSRSETLVGSAATLHVSDLSTLRPADSSTSRNASSVALAMFPPLAPHDSSHRPSRGPLTAPGGTDAPKPEPHVCYTPELLTSRATSSVAALTPLQEQPVSAPSRAVGHTPLEEPPLFAGAAAFPESIGRRAALHLHGTSVSSPLGGAGAQACTVRLPAVGVDMEHSTVRRTKSLGDDDKFGDSMMLRPRPGAQAFAPPPHPTSHPPHGSPRGICPESPEKSPDAQRRVRSLAALSASLSLQHPPPKPA